MLLKRGKLWHTRIMFGGTLHQRPLKTRSRGTALKLESAFRASLVNGEFGIHDTHGTPTLEGFEARLLPHMKANTAPRTYAFYVQNLKVLKAFSPMREAKLHKIDAALIERFIQSRLRQKGKPLAPVTINHSLRTLRRVLHVAEEWALIRKAPRIRLLPGENEREYVISDADVMRFTDGFATLYPDTIMQYLFQFLIDTGLRITEACNLKKEHWTGASIRVVKGKTKNAKREIPLTARARYCVEMAVQRSRCSYVFTGKGGHKPITRHYPSEQFRTVRDGLSVDPACVIHSTRHTFCTRLGTKADAFTIQKLAGHTSILVSQRYVHAGNAAKADAIAALDAMNPATPERPTHPDGAVII